MIFRQMVFQILAVGTFYPPLLLNPWITKFPSPKGPRCCILCNWSRSGLLRIFIPKDVFDKELELGEGLLFAFQGILLSD